MQDTYIAIDGDDVGSRLEYYVLTNQPQPLQSFSESFEGSICWLRQILIQEFSATIVFTGGDNINAVVKNGRKLVFRLENIREEFLERSGRSLSIGLGSTLSEAYMALKLAKASGKNCIRQFGGKADG